jgi:hypothetical protein
MSFIDLLWSYLLCFRFDLSGGGKSRSYPYLAMPSVALLSVLGAQQAEHLRSRKGNIRDRSSCASNRTRVIDKSDLARTATSDLQHGTAGVLRLSNNSHHSIHNLLHRDPLALANPAFTRCPERSQDTSGGDRDDSHALGRLHRCHGFDKVVDCCFGSGVERDCGSGLLGSGGADHYYCAAVVKACEGVECELGAADRVVEVDFQDFVA